MDAPNPFVCRKSLGQGELITVQGALRLPVSEMYVTRWTVMRERCEGSTTVFDGFNHNRLSLG